MLFFFPSPTTVVQFSFYRDIQTDIAVIISCCLYHFKINYCVCVCGYIARRKRSGSTSAAHNLMRLYYVCYKSTCSMSVWWLLIFQAQAAAAGRVRAAYPFFFFFCHFLTNLLITAIIPPSISLDIIITWFYFIILFCLVGSFYFIYYFFSGLDAYFFFFFLKHLFRYIIVVDVETKQ